jgi:hypothetical protein
VETRQAIFREKNDNLEAKLKLAKDEIARVKNAHDGLLEKLKSAVAEAVNGQCADHMSLVATKLKLVQMFKVS